MNKAEELIACLEGEIAKRDETIARLEPQLNRSIQANYDLRAELAAIKAQEPVMWRYKERADDQRSAWLYVKKRMHIPSGHKFEALYAAPVSEAKAQGVVMPEPDFWLDGGATPCYYAEPLRAVLNAAPAAPAADACKACKGTGRRPIGGRGRIFGLTNRCFECQPLTDEEVYGQVTAHE